jgi:hypothetical protein
MTNDRTARPSDAHAESQAESPADARAETHDETRGREAAAEWMAERAEDENTTSDIDGTVTVSDASTPPDPDAYGHAESDTLAVEDHEPASREYPRPDPHNGITQADRQA